MYVVATATGSNESFVALQTGCGSQTEKARNKKMNRVSNVFLHDDLLVRVGFLEEDEIPHHVESKAYR